MHVGKLYCQLWTMVWELSRDSNGDTHEVIWHLRAGIGRIVGLIHAVHDGLDDATVVPRESVQMRVLFVTR